MVLKMTQLGMSAVIGINMEQQSNCLSLIVQLLITSLQFLEYQ